MGCCMSSSLHNSPSKRTLTRGRKLIPNFAAAADGFFPPLPCMQGRREAGQVGLATLPDSALLLSTMIFQISDKLLLSTILHAI